MEKDEEKLAQWRRDAEKKRRHRAEIAEEKKDWTGEGELRSKRSCPGVLTR